MLRKYCQVASIALLGLMASPALANQGFDSGLSSSSPDNKGPSTTKAVYLTAASNKSAGGAQPDSAKSGMERQGDNLHSTPMPIEYPALALLAVAVISMAALSRRDALTFDDNKR